MTGAAAGHRRPVTPDLVTGLRDQGLTWVAIAGRLGCTVSAARRAGDRAPGEQRTPPGPWIAQASCAQDPQAWDAADTAGQLSICRACPVLAPCAAWAHDHRWQGVVIAGWVAPTGYRSRPPTAVTTT